MRSATWVVVLAPPEFMSTHPSDQTRINNLKSKLANAKTYYKGPQ